MRKRSIIFGAIVAAALGVHLRAQSLTPYLGSPVAVPGMILAANFDNGGEGVAYHDTTSGNDGGAYRSTGVDLAASSEGGYTIGWTNAGEWVNYTVNVTATGSYTAQLRIAAQSAGATIHIGFNKSPGSWMAVSIPATGGWQTWSTVSVPLTLVGGVQQMTVLFDNGGVNLSSVNVVASSSGTGNGSSGTGTPYSGSPAPVPGTIQAANFDNGAEGVAYHDTSAANEGGAYRQTGVDIASSSEGGYTIGWISAGEWVNYAVNVAASGAYTAQIRVAAPNAGGTLHIGFNGSPGSWTQASVPATGGWQTWTTINVPMTLTAGTQTMTLTFDTSGYNVSYVTMVSGSSGTPPPIGSGPAEPNSPNVPSGTTGVTTTPNLSWKSSGATSYDVYLGTAIPPPLAASNISTYWWGPSSALAAGTTYNWQVIAKNASGSTPGPIWSFKTAGGSSPPPPPPTGNGRLRVMTWNINNGFDPSHTYTLAQQVSFMAAQNVDVIVLQEVQTWDENQPARIPALIQQVTGQTWYSVWVPGTGCLTSSGCAGDLMLSRLPIAASNTSFTGISGMGRIVVNVGSVPVNIVDIHLEYYDTNLRTTELLGMMAWARGFGGPRLVGGDFNSWWGEYWIGQMKTEYSDTWLDVTANQDGGYTTGNVRFDYWFRAFDNAGRLTPLTCSVPSTALSDHRPVVAEYAVQ